MPVSLADQTVQQLGGTWSVLVRQRRDHARLGLLLEPVRATAGDERDEVLQQVCRLVFPHAYAEETVLWPALRAAIPDGEQLTLRVEQEHQEINELVARLDRSAPGDPGREELIERVLALLDQDVRDEEDELLPRLQAVSDERSLRRLGVLWEAVRRTAPTRPHAVVSRRPPGNLLAAVPLTVLDRSRDALDRAARRGPGTVRPVATAGSRALAVVAGAVEQLPPLQVREDPSTRPGRTA